MSVYWNAAESLWALFEPEMASNRYWCGFGVQDPLTDSMLSITCEINFPYEGINRRVAGRFVRRSNNQTYVTHTGKVGGGRPGIGQAAFLEFNSEWPRDTILWPDGQNTLAYVIAQLDSPQLAHEIGRFVRKVADFKALVAGGRG